MYILGLELVLMLLYITQIVSEREINGKIVKCTKTIGIAMIR